VIVSTSYQIFVWKPRARRARRSSVRRRSSAPPQKARCASNWNRRIR